MQHLGDKTTLITGSGSNRRHIPIMPIYHALGQNNITHLLIVISLVVYLAKANLLGGMHSVQLVEM